VFIPVSWLLQTSPSSSSSAGTPRRAASPPPKIGMSGRVTAMISAELQSAKTSRASTASGTVTVSTSWGR
jgi:hypothetical protein